MAKRKTQILPIHNAGGEVSNTGATSAFISTSIPMPSGEWSLNVYFSGLTVSGKNPTFTIYVSNSEAAGSFDELEDAIDIETPRFVFDRNNFPGKFMLITYDPQGATGGLKFFDLYVEQ